MDELPGPRKKVTAWIERYYKRRIFLYPLAALFVVNILTLVLLLNSDCFQWWHPLSFAMHRLLAAVLTLISLFGWMLFSFLGGGYLFTHRSPESRRREWERHRYRANLVRATFLPLVYFIWASWGFISLVGLSIPSLGILSVCIFFVYEIVLLVATRSEDDPLTKQ